MIRQHAMPAVRAMRYAFTSYKDRCPVCCPDQKREDDELDNYEQVDEVYDDDD